MTLRQSTSARSLTGNLFYEQTSSPKTRWKATGLIRPYLCLTLRPLAPCTSLVVRTMGEWPITQRSASCKASRGAARRLICSGVRQCTYPLLQLGSFLLAREFMSSVRATSIVTTAGRVCGGIGGCGAGAGAIAWDGGRCGRKHLVKLRRRRDCRTALRTLPRKRLPRWIKSRVR